MTTPDPYPPGFEPFIAAIQADVAADLPRLLFADWLDDHGDPDRAEFIRLQCRFTRWDPGVLSMRFFRPPVRTSAERRAVARLEQLFEKNRLRWLAGLPLYDANPQSADWTVFQRGFVGRFSRSPKELARDDWLALRRVTPVQGVWVSRVNRGDADVFGTDRLTGVSSLCLDQLSAAAVPALVDAPVLPSLRRLSLFGKGRADHRVFDRLLGSSAPSDLSDLSELRVGGFKPADVVADAVAGSKSLRNLRSLSPTDAALTPAGFGRLLAAPLFRRLRRLTLSDGAADEAVVRLLVEAPAPPKLEELNLSRNLLGPGAFRLLAGWEGLRTVRTLNLRRNAPGLDGLQALGRSRHADRLVSLQLPEFTGTAAEVRAVRRLPVFARLRDGKGCRLEGGPQDY